MCGIGGILTDWKSQDRLQPNLIALQKAIRHRGPDDQGIFIDATGSIGLVHTRLAILDLSPAGHQPMQLDDDRYTIVFNGEVYNFRELRSELIQLGHSFRSDSDTEVILALYKQYGSEFVTKMSGMYAFAIHDRDNGTVFFARDPLGIKPLYYVHAGTTLVFASEVKALLELGFVEKKLCPSALRGYFLFGSYQDTDTAIEGIKSLASGHSMLWDAGKITLNRFWRPHHPSVAPRSESHRIAKEALEESVSRHLVSDVPVGVFLSGGIDSTSLVAIMRRLGVANIKTFSISFDDDRYNEGDDAKRTADHFQTEHHDWRMTAEDGKGLLKKFLAASDQPSIDGFNTFCVSKLAHDHGMKVVLSGLGGDELFGGYPSFQTVPRINMLHLFMHKMRLSKPLGAALEGFSKKDSWKRLGACMQTLPNITAAYWAMRGIFTPREVSELCASYVDNVGSIEENAEQLNWKLFEPWTSMDAVSKLELTRYMCNQLLRESDVMSMAWGLELRVPFVDRKLVDTLWTIPSAMRLQPGKRLLVETVPELPSWILNRPKRGFVFPFEEWAKEVLANDFARVQKQSSVPMKTWFRAWSLMALNNFVAKHGMANADEDSNVSLGVV